MKFLRTLTGKSKMGFGRFSNLTVNQILKKPQGDYYIRWAYYRMSMISFHEDILNIVGIKPDDRIEKPGNAPAKFEGFPDYNTKRGDVLLTDMDSKKNRLMFRNQKYCSGRSDRDKLFNQGHRWRK